MIPEDFQKGFSKYIFTFLWLLRISCSSFFLLSALLFFFLLFLVCWLCSNLTFKFTVVPSWVLGTFGKEIALWSLPLQLDALFLQSRVHIYDILQCTQQHKFCLNSIIFLIFMSVKFLRFFFLWKTEIKAMIKSFLIA